MTSRELATAQFRHINIRGAELAYTDTGEGKEGNLVLVHPNLGDLRSWDSIVPQLAPTFRVITYSRRFHWPNVDIEDGVADPWEEHADDLAELIEKLNLGPAYVQGNSSSATMALILARRRPELVRALVLEEPPLISLFLRSTPPSLTDVVSLLWLHPRSFFPTMYFGATVVGPTGNAFKAGNDNAALAAFCKGVFGSDFFTRVSHERQQQVRENLMPHRALFCYGTMPGFLDADVQAVQMPVLVLTGQRTANAQLHINRRLTELLPNGEEVIIVDATHFVHEDQPEAVVQAVTQFIGRVKARVV